MSRALQFTEKFFDGKPVGLCDVIQRAEASQVTAYAGGLPVDENPREDAVLLQDLGNRQVR
jgi:hypothetical protein